MQKSRVRVLLGVMAFCVGLSGAFSASLVQASDPRVIF